MAAGLAIAAFSAYEASKKTSESVPALPSGPTDLSLNFDQRVYYGPVPLDGGPSVTQRNRLLPSILGAPTYSNTAPQPNAMLQVVLAAAVLLLAINQ